MPTGFSIKLSRKAMGFPKIFNTRIFFYRIDLLTIIIFASHVFYPRSTSTLHDTGKDHGREGQAGTGADAARF